jgi:hypothetical protein
MRSTWSDSLNRFKWVCFSTLLLRGSLSFADTKSTKVRNSQTSTWYRKTKLMIRMMRVLRTKKWTGSRSNQTLGQQLSLTSQSFGTPTTSTKSIWSLKQSWWLFSSKCYKTRGESNGIHKLISKRLRLYLTASLWGTPLPPIAFLRFTGASRLKCRELLLCQSIDLMIIWIYLCSGVCSRLKTFRTRWRKVRYLVMRFLEGMELILT